MSAGTRMARGRPPAARAGGRGRRRADPQPRARRRRERPVRAARRARSRPPAARRHHRSALARDPARRPPLVRRRAGRLPRTPRRSPAATRRSASGSTRCSRSAGSTGRAAAIGGFSQGTVMSYALALGEGRPAPGGDARDERLHPRGRGLERRAGTALSACRLHPPRRRRPGDRGRLRPRRPPERLEAAGSRPRYRETPAGHWLPPEIVGEARSFVAAAPASSALGDPAGRERSRRDLARVVGEPAHRDLARRRGPRAAAAGRRR